MAVEGFSKCLKYLFLIVNFFFLGLGLAVLGVGVYTLKIGDVNLGPVNDIQYPIGFIILGAIVAVFAFFGCCGAWKESKFMLTMYAIVISLLLIAQIAIIVYAATYAQHDATFLSNTWGQFSDDLKNKTQTFKNCCGFDNSTDREFLPCPSGATVGCKAAILDYASQYTAQSKNVIYAGGALLAVEFIGLVISLVVCCAIHSISAT